MGSFSTFAWCLLVGQPQLLKPSLTNLSVIAPIWLPGVVAGVVVGEARPHTGGRCVGEVVAVICVLTERCPNYGRVSAGSTPLSAPSHRHAHPPLMHECFLPTLCHPRLFPPHSPPPACPAGGRGGLEGGGGTAWLAVAGHSVASIFTSQPLSKLYWAQCQALCIHVKCQSDNCTAPWCMMYFYWWECMESSII